MNRSYNKPRRPRYRFEEEEKPVEGETETTTEEGGEEGSTPDTHEQFINILVEMGLSADQAEAVHQMAMDLVNAGGKQESEAPATEMSRSRGRNFERSRDYRGRSRSREFNRGFESRQFRSERGEFREDRREVRGRRFSQINEMEMRVMLRRQSRQIMELQRQLQELSAQPAARPERVQQQFTTTHAQMPTQGSILDRVKSYVQQHQK